MDLIIRPIVTEKITNQTELFNRYAFVVSRLANKIDIKKSIEVLYDVKVKSVRTMNYYGKTKSRFTKAGVVRGKKSAFKKAIVELFEGSSIDFYNNV
ncbi:MAG: 50S ribosomal protein L23 [Flavobacteriales bacterium]|jgi:large subunit ribosomal protein L23|nr:50S ribosomal protein L23 [Flavobacteriales bacterium]|tara:strand:+ start:1261 stop:1551 length:291 start_codon:yes stop_codon:yes gene_type:complete